MYSIVLTVDGQERFVLAARFGGDQFSRRNQAFLVGQPDRLSGSYGFIRALSPATPTIALTTKSTSG